MPSLPKEPDAEEPQSRVALEVRTVCETLCEILALITRNVYPVLFQQYRHDMLNMINLGWIILLWPDAKNLKLL